MVVGPVGYDKQRQRDDAADDEAAERGDGRSAAGRRVGRRRPDENQYRFDAERGVQPQGDDVTFVVMDLAIGGTLA